MRAYLPLTWAQLQALHAAGSLEGPLRGCAVDPAWREGSPDVDEEQWEYEAQSAAAEELSGADGGVVLAVDLDDSEPTMPPTMEDGRFTHPGPVARQAASAVLTADLAWFGMQEIPELLNGR